MKRRFEFTDEKSNKFWEIALDGNEQIVHFGRIGTAGQEKRKKFASPAEAQQSVTELIAEKTGKGYKEVPPEN